MRIVYSECQRLRIHFVLKKTLGIVKQSTQNSWSSVFGKPERKASKTSAELARNKISVSVGGTKEAI